MRFSDEDLQYKVDFVNSRLNVDKVIYHYGIKGRVLNDDYLGCCPLHDDKSPSFSINTKTGLWICWGCNETGNIFQLIKNIEDISYRDAVEWLAKLLGIKNYIPSMEFLNGQYENLHKPPSFEKKEDGELKEIQLPHECDSAIFYPIAFKRVAKQEIKHFKIKYCNRGFYRGHLIIPIVFEKKLVAFFARDMLDQSEKTKKYNPGAKTGKIFFNWDDAILYPDYVIVVEGIIDCIKIWSWGYNCVALLGISLSVKKRTMLFKYFTKIYLVLDNDHKEKYDANGEHVVLNPGQAAAIKLKSGMHYETKIYNVLLPQGKDPDECTLQEFEKSLYKAKLY